jgi:hypothetical protein
MVINMKVSEIRKEIEKVGIPGRDLNDLPSSTKTFPDGCNYRIEISGVERLSTLEALVDEMEKRKVPVHRLISTVLGSTYLPKDELEGFAELAKEKKLEVIITPGPRVPWDIGRQVATPEGSLSGLRPRGSEGLVYLVSDVLRCSELGFRGFLVTGEGALWLLSELRKNGVIPKDTRFKVSIYAGHANPAGARILENLGADTFNPVADLGLPSLAAIRKATHISMDIHICLAESMGGFNRIWEGPELARVTSPCYFKIEPGPGLAATGGIYKPWTSEQFHADLIRTKVMYAENLIGIIEENNPELKLSKQGAPDLAIPR